MTMRFAVVDEAAQKMAPRTGGIGRAGCGATGLKSLFRNAYRLAVGRSGRFTPGAPFGVGVVPRIADVRAAAGLEDAEHATGPLTAGRSVAIAVAIAGHNRFCGVAAGRWSTGFDHCQ